MAHHANAIAWHTISANSKQKVTRCGRRRRRRRCRSIQLAAMPKRARRVGRFFLKNHPTSLARRLHTHSAHVSSRDVGVLSTHFINFIFASDLEVNVLFI